MRKFDIPNDAEPIGYSFLVQLFKMSVLPHFRWSYVSRGWKFNEFREDHTEVHLYPKSYQIDQDPLKHVEFALKHEGMNLAILKETFSQLGPDIVKHYIQKSPKGKYARKIWFLYEWLVDELLSLEDLDKGPYIPLLDVDAYYCGYPKKSQRHRVVDNLLGNKHFSPLVRRSKKLIGYENKQLHSQAVELTKKYDEEVLSRAVRYLYTKETMASWEIEKEKPDKSRVVRFVNLLQQSHSNQEFNQRFLVLVQKEIVDPRFAIDSFRTFQNYVGEEPQLGEMILHYISPKPQDLPSLMEGLIQNTERMFASKVDPVIVAAVLSFGFVFMHPFWDGNGRLHRFLIHYTLSKLRFALDGVVFPVSAVMLREYKEYNKVLEYFSAPLMQYIHDYKMDDRGEMIVNQDTADFYKYIDFTPIAEFLYHCVEQTIYTDLEKELAFLSRYDQIKGGIKQIIDMPDKEIDLFIRCVRQNSGTLSLRKRETLFSFLTDEEIGKMEKVIDEAN